MSRVDDLRAQLAVAELEDRLSTLKESADVDALGPHEEEVRYARWVARGGPQEEQDSLANSGAHTSRAAADHYARWSATQQEG